MVMVGDSGNLSVLLELSASDDLIGFKMAVEEAGHDIDEPSNWYGRRIGLRKIGLEERTPLMIAAMFGSKQILGYILETGLVDVNRACGSDGATALHCAVMGGSDSSPDIVKLLINASADTCSLDSKGNELGSLISPSLSSIFGLRRKMPECLLKGRSNIREECVEKQKDKQVLAAAKEGSEKKEYPVDPSLPDINNGIYGTDEFRMYVFKVKPCTRAYSHDWTECPFVHPGENARRRDPRKYHYSCVPCPEFRKGMCRMGDACEYAHGIFECWLHPAQYRTRLCKDEMGCSRRVCFFAHKPEELRPLYVSTSSAVISPRSFSSNTSFDMASITPFSSTLSMSPSSPVSSKCSSMWQKQNQTNIVPPTLQLPGNRLKAVLRAREMELGSELYGFGICSPRRPLLVDDMSSVSSPSSWNNTLATAAAFAASSIDPRAEFNRAGVVPTNLDHYTGSLDPAILSQLEALSLNSSASQMQSPPGMQARQSMGQNLHPSYPASLSPSPVRTLPSFGIDPSGAAAAFANRSQSFIDRNIGNHRPGVSSPASSATILPPALSDWGSPDGKLNWGIQKEDFNKLRKSTSFGFQSNSSNLSAPESLMMATTDGLDVSWVRSLVKDGAAMKPRYLDFEGQHQRPQQYQLNSGGSEMLPHWVEQRCMEPEQMVA